MNQKKANFIHMVFLSICMIAASMDAQSREGLDSCTVNDICQTAIDLDTLFASDQFICIQGCNLDANPESFNNPCQVGNFPAVWYKVTVGTGAFMHISVRSQEFESPVISVYRSADCQTFSPVLITNSNLPCLVGSDGIAEAMGTVVFQLTTYYILISSFEPDGGAFELCIRTSDDGSYCVMQQTLSVVSRSFPGPLTGPFHPGERIGICMSVDSFTAAGNGCQWFQGLVPVFGDGWDPSSFDNDGQPLGATINGTPAGVAGNGIYGSSTWDWFSDVDYHFDYPFLQIGDFDNNGTIELCNSLYHSQCPDLGGINGGCCGPCWGTPLGDILPPGWFSYGINGSCPTPGPPIRVDWGDGNTCGGGMGPWHFCFELVTRGYPGCLEDPAARNLSLGFFTFSDGEVGSWTGNASVCAKDQPVQLNLALRCGMQTDLPTEILPDLCSGEIFTYEIYEQGIAYWEWTIDPPGVVINPSFSGDNGIILHHEVISSMMNPVSVTYSFTGYETATQNIVTKKVQFNINSSPEVSIPLSYVVCKNGPDPLTLQPDNLSGGEPPYSMIWLPSGDTASSLILSPPFQNQTIDLIVTGANGCTTHTSLEVILKPCFNDTIRPLDDSLEKPTHQEHDHGGEFGSGVIEIRSVLEEVSPRLKLYPIPAKESVIVEWTFQQQSKAQLMIRDTNGRLLWKRSLNTTDVRHEEINLAGWPPGVYIVLLSSESTVSSARLIKL